MSPQLMARAVVGLALSTSAFAQEPARPLDTGEADDGGRALDVSSAAPGAESGIRVTVDRMLVSEVLAGIEARAGHTFLEIGATFENDIPLSLAFGGEREVGDRVLVVLRQRLFLLARSGSDRALSAFAPRFDIEAEGLFPEKFELPYLGSSVEGRIVFEVPRAVAESDDARIALELVPEEFAPVRVHLRGSSDDVEAVDSESFEPAATNEYVRWTAPVLRRPEKVLGEPPPPGSQWIAVDLAGRASGDDPALYLEAASHLQLVADGEWASTPERALGTLPDVPVFLADHTTGGSAVFLAPADAESLELVAVFPLLRNFPSDGLETKPETLRFPLLGATVPEPAGDALAEVADEPVTLEVTRANVVGTAYAGYEADDESALVALTLRLENEDDEDGLFDVPSRFGGDGVVVLDVVGRGAFPLPSKQLLPAGSRRSMRLLLSVPRGAAREGEVSLGYSGVSVHQGLTLALSEPASEPARSEPGPDPGEPEEVDSSTTEPAFSWVRPGGLLVDRAGTALEPELARSGASVENGVLRLEVESATLEDGVEDREPGEGAQFLVLEIRISPLRHEGGDAPRVHWPDLGSSLHLVVDGRRIVPRVRGLKNAPALSRSSGDEPVSGILAYEVPRGSLRSCSLHLVDPWNGNAVLQVVGKSPEGDRSSDPLSGPMENGAIECGVFGWSVEEEGARATVAVDLRGRSLRRAIGADHGGRTERLDHVPSDWREGRIHLLVDGTYAVPVHGSDVAKPMRWLPDAMVGGVLRFRLPSSILRDAVRVELVVGARPVPTEDGPLVVPRALRFPLLAPSIDATVDARGTPDVLWTIDDDRLSVSAVERIDATGRAEGNLAVRVRVENGRETPVWFDPIDRIRCSGGDGAFQPVKPRLLASMPRPLLRPRTLWIPPGDARVFDLPFASEDGAPDPPSLRYEGLLRHVDVPLEQGAAPRTPEMPVIAGAALYDRTRPVGGIASVGLDPSRVHRAIDRGRDWLWSTLRAEAERGRQLGVRDDHYPMLLALVHCDLHEDEPAFDDALRAFLGSVRPSQMKGKSTYKVGILAMIIAAYGDPSFRTLHEDTARYLVEDQGPNGTWGYGTNTPSRVFALEPRDDPDPDGGASAATGPLVVRGGPAPPATSRGEDVAGSEPRPVERTLDFTVNGGGDNSVTQYAALGLEACARSGIAVEPEAWRRLLSAMWNRRHARGSWGYTSEAPYGSMACAGTSIAAIAMRALEPTRDPLDDPRLREALTWLAENHAVGRNPGARSDGKAHLYYHMYGLERVGRLLDTEFFGPHEWYPGTAKWLVDAQSEDGAWPPGVAETERLASSFALLFLTRATETLDPVASAVERAEADAARPRTGRLEMRARVTEGRGIVFVLDASGSMLAPPGARERGATPKFELARAALRSALDELPDGVPVGLVVYGHRKRAREDGADEDVEVVVPVGAFDPDEFSTALGALDARGLTPLARALEEAREALRTSGLRSGTIVLLTDGGQRREPGDPLKSAESVRKAGFALEIVGFDVDESRSPGQAAWTEQLRAMARVAEGRYRSVVESGELGAAVAAAATGRPGSFEVSDDTGRVVAEGAFGGAITLPAGSYVFRTSFAGEPLEQTIEIGRGRTTRVEFDAGALR